MEWSGKERKGKEKRKKERRGGERRVRRGETDVRIKLFITCDDNQLTKRLT